MIRKDVINILNVYFKEDKHVHISCDGRFYNGYILGIDSKSNIIFFNDDVLGDLPIPFDNMDIIEPYKEKSGSSGE